MHQHDGENLASAESSETPFGESELIALLFEAGKTEAVLSDAVTDVLLEALKSGRDVHDVIEDHDILSRKQRQSIQRVVSDNTRQPSRRTTVGSAKQDTRPHQIPSTKSRGNQHRTPDSAAEQFRKDQAELLPLGTDRYNSIEEIGRGGWGVVVRAHDKQLDRDVAVKKLGAQASQDSDVARRFLHEARITGQLQHPGIVPVFERGISPDDRQPYYAMKLLDGTTLKDVITAYHAAPAGRAKRKQFHSLLISLIDVCNAVGYAHSRTIIHRDLKPANIIVGEFGETVVVDWGLAKDLSDATQSEEANVATVQGGTPLPATAKSGRLDGMLDSAVTRHGSVIGTPAFMSPEQARGAVSEIDSTSDTYSLGTILYVILAGELPFHGDDVQTTLKQVIEGEYRSPRAINKQVPTALEAICVKAMSRDRADRYQNAEQLANDLQHYIANEPVSAHKDSLLDKAGRWCRRNPTIAATSIAAGIIISVGGLITSAIVGEANRTERLAKIEAQTAQAAEKESRIAAEESQQRAIQRLEESRLAADAWLIGLSGTLQKYPGMQSVRRDLMSKARMHYEQLQATTINDPELQLEAARSKLRLADLHMLSEEIDQATAEFVAAAKLLKTIPASTTQPSILREQLNAETGIMLAALHGESQHETHATALLAVVNAVKAAVPAESIDNEFRNSLCRAHIAAGRGYESAGLHEQAISTLRESLQFAELIDQNDDRQQHLLATIRQDLSRIYSATNSPAEAIEVLNKQLEASTKQLTTSPERPDLLESRAVARMKWAAAKRQLGDTWAAENAYRGAVEDLSSAWQLLFGDHFYSENLAIAQANLGQMALGHNRLEDAENMLREAIDQLTGLMQSGQADRQTASRLAACNVALGKVLVLTGNAAAEETIRRSIAVYDYLEQQSSLTKSDQRLHCQAIANLGHSLYATKQHELAAQQFDAAFDVLDAAEGKLATENPVVTSWIQLMQSKTAAAMGDTDLSKKHRELAVTRLSAAAKLESPAQSVREDSATLLLVQTLLNAGGDKVEFDKASHKLARLPINSSSPGHLHQLQAVAAYRVSAYEESMRAIDRAIASRRFPLAIDYAVKGCICYQQGNRTAAGQHLERASTELAVSPGNLQLSEWVTELAQLVQSDQP